MTALKKILFALIVLTSIHGCKKESKKIDTIISSNKENEWEKLLGNDLSGWNIYLGFPQNSQEVVGLKRDENGK